MHRPKGLYVIETRFFEQIYGPSERADLEVLADIYASPQTPNSIRENSSLLRECEVLFSGWGGPIIDEDFLAAAPNLKIIFFAGGTVGNIVTEAMWERDVIITSSYSANAVPVVEYVLGMIFFSLKHGWHYAFDIKRKGRYPKKWRVPGSYQSTVGLISMGAVARMLCERLRSSDLKIIAYDPYLTPQEANILGIDLVSLDEVFSKSDLVSIHTPALAETHGMIDKTLLGQMKNGATLINTSRGAVINEHDLITVATQRTDLQIILDVTDPEPPVPGSPLYNLPNVVLTPHIAGSMDSECRRMARYMIEELTRYNKGEPLRWVVTPELARISSHRPSFMTAQLVP